MTGDAPIVAIDAMGGDLGVKATIQGGLVALKAHPTLTLILVGDQKKIKRVLKKQKALKEPRLRIHHADEEVAMDEAPSQALRTKKKSSMRLAIDLVKAGEAHACVSSGNTGALMATSRFVLKMLPGIDRPAIVYAIPAINLKTGQRTLSHMLDLGANVDCSADHLFQFAVMGSVLSSSVDNTKKPRVALLNIGEEEMKGLDNIKQAANQLSECKDINYVGYIEGNALFFNQADVIVCDGFIGNIAVKSMEGVAKYMMHTVKETFTRNWWAKLQAVFAMPALSKIKRRLDLKHFNGASFLGLRGIVVKSHGGSDGVAFAAAIHEAIKEIEKDVPGQIHAHLEAVLGDK